MKTENWKLKITWRKPLAIALILALALTTVLTLAYKDAPVAQASWFDASWNYRQKIIIDHTKVPNTDQTDFPVLIKITDANNPIFSTKVQDDGDDIRFTGSDETTQLSHEIESYSKSTHELWAWVKVPTLSHETDTTIYLYYGNDSATALSAAEKQAVWSNGYAGVWHMGDNSANTSVVNSLGLTNGVAQQNTSALSVSGKTSGSLSFNGSSDYINIASLPSLAGGGSFCAWSKLDATGSDPEIMSYVGGGSFWELRYSTSTKKPLSLWNFSTMPYPIISPDALNLEEWHNICSTTSSDTTRILYVDGINKGQVSGGSYGAPLALNLGRRFSGGLYMQGSIDEVKVSLTARSADWIATEYANQNSPETFYTIRTEVNKATGLAQVNPTGWYDSEWGSRQPISLNNTHDKVPNTDQTDFPVLVKVTDAGNRLFAAAQSDGDDILFTSSDGTTKLAHEIEKYDAVTHELWAWVKIPTLATGTDTKIYMYYGNGSSASQQSATAVWSNGYAGVWHLGDPTNPVDSTVNNNDAISNSSTERIGKISRGGDLVAASSQNIVKTSLFTDDILGNGYSVSFWMNADASTDLTGIVSIGSEELDTSPNMIVQSRAGNSIRANSPGIYSATISASAGTSYLVTYTYEGNATRQSYLYLNAGTPEGAVALVGATASRGANLYLGVGYNGYYDGMIDEARVSSTARSADWIATEYNNQNSPETFMSFGDFETADSYAPSNPTTITSLNGSGGEPLGNAGTSSTPYYSWPQPEADGGATDQTGQYISGVAGYYSYFGTSCGDGGADPVMTRGLLSDTGSGLHYSSDTSISVPDLTTNQDSYCLRLRTRDIAGNISSTTEVATYNFDLTNPLPPTFISVNPAGYSSTDSFEFSWPPTADNTGGSGIQGYQYKRGIDAEWSPTQATTKIAGITHYNETGGENTFLVRSVDNAGNVSSEVQTTYYYSANPPTKPTGLTATPALSDQNFFSFSWGPPSNPARPIVDYGYSVNASPEFSEGSNNITWTGNNTTSLPADAYATLQGVNTLYLIAKDDSGAFSLEPASVAEVQFNCTTPAPSIPTAVSISDSSNRAINLWALTIKWSAGINQNPDTFDHYSIERSSDAPEAETGHSQTFTEIATTESLAYIDSNGLNNTTPYYYRIKAVDNAGSVSASSQLVSKTPTGKYTSPPSLVSEPIASVKATTATISWVVNRTSSSAIRFGNSNAELSRSQIDPASKTSQSISLVGLEPATTYYYQVQSLDDFRDYSSESAYSSLYSFTTLPAPTISKVEVSNLTLTTADISWETSSASNTKVYFGTSISYGTSLSESDTSMTTKHTVKLTGLSHTTKYHFKIQGLDIDNNSLSSDDYTFETLPMPTISKVSYQPDFSGPAPVMNITWTTNVPASSSVEYTPKGLSDAVTFESSQSALVKEHKVTLSNLQDDTEYSFLLFGTDSFGNTTKSDTNTLHTGFDTRPAKISQITIETSNVGLDKQDKAQIAVSWKTDEPTTSQVEYGEGISGSGYSNKTTEDRAFTTNHLVIIPDLSPNKPYHIRAVVTDKGSNITKSEDHTVIPGDVPRSALQIILQTFTRLFGWLGL